MKKIKAIIAIIGILAVVGGTLAFKVNKFSDTYCIGKIYAVGDPSPQNCNVRVVGTVTIDAFTPYRWAKITTGANCNGQICVATLKLTDESEN